MLAASCCTLNTNTEHYLHVCGICHGEGTTHFMYADTPSVLRPRTWCGYECSGQARPCGQVLTHHMLPAHAPPPLAGARPVLEEPARGRVRVGIGKWKQQAKQYFMEVKVGMCMLGDAEY